MFGSLKMRGTHRGSFHGVPFQIIIGGHWLIQAAVEHTWLQMQVFLGSSVRLVLHAIHISVRITHSGLVGSISSVNTFPLPHS